MSAKDIAEAPSLMDMAFDRDAIAVRDYLREIEIGAFQQERGVAQRVRFSVVLDTDHTEAAENDDVDKVLSYDSIVEAIEAELAAERVNLLETLAERIAARCLTDSRVRRVHVRIEKLDRIPGSLGVEIIRHAASDTILGAGRGGQSGDVTPQVYLLTNNVLESGRLMEWLDAVTALPEPAIITLEPTKDGLPDGTSDCILPIQRRIGLLSIEQNAWLLASRDDRCVVVSSRTELDHAAKNGRLSVWAPSKIVLDATDRPASGAEDPVGLAKWFAEEIGAAGLTIVGTGHRRKSGAIDARVLDPKDPTALAP